MYDGYQALRIERRGSILVVTLDNPPLNAMTPQAHLELARLFPQINHDPETSVVVLTGAGNRAFSAGGNIKRMAERVERGDHADWIKGAFEAKEIVYGLLRLERPLIARINGDAMGLGATLAVLADITFMIGGATIADTHVKVGLSAGDGGSLIWPLLMGFPLAKRYLLTGDALTGWQAAEFGLITEAVETLEELDAKVFELADRLGNGATHAVNATKISINLLLRRMLEGVIEAHLGLETYTYLSKDHRAAAIAFRDRAPVDFTGE